jgi:O-antigen ligase
MDRTTKGNSTIDKKYEIIDRIIEYGIYLYVIFMFLSKGESIRSILIYGNFALWLFTLKYRKNLYLLKEPVSILCWTYLGISIISVIFSIDPMYSLSRFKMDPLIFAVLFPVIATVMSDETRLKRMACVCLFTAVFISLIGYYSYISHDLLMLKPDITLMHVHHNKFAKYLNTLLPVAFILYFIWKRPVLRGVLTVSFVILILALLLNTSRGGYISFFSMVLIWSVYLARTRGHSITRIMAIVIAITFLIGTLSWFLFPDLKTRILANPLNDRINAGTAAMYGIKQRPLHGWGYGKKIFHKNEPFDKTPLKISPYNDESSVPYDDPHNTFLTVLFHQGIIGFIPYVFLVFLSVKMFWKEALRSRGIKSYMLVACVSVLVGNYFLHSMFSLMKLRYLALVLGIGMAAKGNDRN